MKTNNQKPLVIGIAGAVGSGKTWFANQLKESLEQPVCIFTLDIYSKDIEYVNTLEYRYDNPLAIDFDKAYSDLSKLIKGESVTLPIYDYVSHSIVSEKTYAAPTIIIIEGLYSFYDKRFLDAMDFKIWIEIDEQLCLERRINRDIIERGETREESMFRHLNDSQPAYEKFYKDGRLLADVVFVNTNTRRPMIATILSSYISTHKK